MLDVFENPNVNEYSEKLEKNKDALLIAYFLIKKDIYDRQDECIVNFKHYYRAKYVNGEYSDYPGLDSTNTYIICNTSISWLKMFLDGLESYNIDYCKEILSDIDCPLPVKTFISLIIDTAINSPEELLFCEEMVGLYKNLLLILDFLKQAVDDKTIIYKFFDTVFLNFDISMKKQIIENIHEYTDNEKKVFYPLVINIFSSHIIILNYLSNGFPYHSIKLILDILSGKTVVQTLGENIDFDLNASRISMITKMFFVVLVESINAVKPGFSNKIKDNDITYPYMYNIQQANDEGQ